MIIDDCIITWLDAVLIDRKAQGVSDGTLHYYLELVNFQKVNLNLN